MELFVVRNIKGNKLGSFESKPAAKAFRDSLGGVESGIRVSRGKDNLKSPRGNPSMMRLKPKHCT